MMQTPLVRYAPDMMPPVAIIRCPTVRAYDVSNRRFRDTNKAFRNGLIDRHGAPMSYLMGSGMRSTLALARLARR